MLKRVSLVFFTMAGVAGASTFGACSSSSSGGGVDGGMDSHTSPVDVVTVFETSPPDIFVGLPDRTSTETGAPDVVTPVPESGADRVSPADAKTEAGHVAEAGKEGGVVSHFDAGACTKVGLPAASTPPSTCSAGAAGTCSPSLVPTLPPVSPPTGAYQGVCTAAQIVDIYNDCLSGNSCTEADEGNAALACYNCINPTPQSASAWGPIILTAQNVLNLNFGGCINLLEPCNSACGDAVEEEFACTEAACGANCVNADNDAGTFTPLATCGSTADNCDPNGCFVPANDAYGTGGCVSQLTGSSHPASVCAQALTNTSLSFEQAYEVVAGVFCGSPP